MPEQKEALRQADTIRMYLNQYQYAVSRFENTVAWKSLIHLKRQVDALYEESVPEDIR